MNGRSNQSRPNKCYDRVTEQDGLAAAPALDRRRPPIEPASASLDHEQATGRIEQDRRPTGEQEREARDENAGMRRYPCTSCVSQRRVRLRNRG